MAHLARSTSTLVRVLYLLSLWWEEQTAAQEVCAVRWLVRSFLSTVDLLLACAECEV